MLQELVLLIDLDVIVGTRKLISAINPVSAGLGEVLINDESVNVDFRVESDSGTTPTHAFFVDGSSGYIGIHDSSPTQALEVSGSLTVSNGLTVGNITATTTIGKIEATNDIIAYSTSDKRLKENILPIDNPIEKVLQISGVNFDWKKLDEEGIKLYSWK